MTTPAEIAAALFSAPHLNEETLAPLYEYRREKGGTGAPVDLESAVLRAAYKCQEAADNLREFAERIGAEVVKVSAGIAASGTRYDSTIFYLGSRESVESMAKRLRVAREHFNALLDVWQHTADRIVATPEETAAKAAEVAQVAGVKRSAAIATWTKFDRASLAAEAIKRGVAADGTKTEMALALVNAGHFS